MKGILDGVRVLDLGRFISCPFCGMILADLGADVIKIERVKGEDGRRLGPFKNGKSLYVDCFNRNKKGITINFRSEKGKAIFRELVKKSDVVLENFRPGTMDEMGFGYEELEKINPGIILASISGFGQYGPYRNRPAFDGIGSAMGGLMNANSQKGVPCHIGVPIVDHVAGLYTALAVVLALYEKQRSGRGQCIDSAMVDCIFSMMETTVPQYVISGDPFRGEHPNKSGADGDPLTCPTNLYKTKNGYVSVHAGTDPNFKNFAPLTGDPELMDPKYQKIEARMADYAKVDALAAKWFASVTVEEAEQKCSSVGVPCGIVSDIGRIMQDPNSSIRKQIVYIDIPGVGEMPFAGNPLKFSETPITQFNRAPELGEHNHEIYRQLLGMDQDDIRTLRENGDI